MPSNLLADNWKAMSPESILFWTAEFYPFENSAIAQSSHKSLIKKAFLTT